VNQGLDLNFELTPGEFGNDGSKAALSVTALGQLVAVLCAIVEVLRLIQRIRRRLQNLD